MANDQDAVRIELGRCHGFLAVARDGPVGEVDRPLFPPGVDTPDYVVVRTSGPRPRRPVVPVALIERLDPARRLLFLRTKAKQIEDLPEHLPVAEWPATDSRSSAGPSRARVGESGRDPSPLHEPGGAE